MKPKSNETLKKINHHLGSGARKGFQNPVAVEKKAQEESNEKFSGDNLNSESAETNKAEKPAVARKVSLSFNYTYTNEKLFIL